MLVAVFLAGPRRICFPTPFLPFNRIIFAVKNNRNYLTSVGGDLFISPGSPFPFFLKQTSKRGGGDIFYCLEIEFCREYFFWPGFAPHSPSVTIQCFVIKLGKKYIVFRLKRSLGTFFFLFFTLGDLFSFFPKRFSLFFSKWGNRGIETPKGFFITKKTQDSHFIAVTSWSPKNITTDRPPTIKHGCQVRRTGFYK